MAERVYGFCPMGCGETLVLGSGGHVTCSYIPCPDPSAVSKLLEDREHEHVATFAANGYLVRHPLRERIDGQLELCDLNVAIESMNAAPGGLLGRYRVTRGAERWDFAYLG